MSNRLWPLLLVFLSIASIVLASSEKPEIKIDVSGTWKWTMQRQNGGGREVRLKLEQQGEKLTGSISGMGSSCQGRSRPCGSP